MSRVKTPVAMLAKIVLPTLSCPVIASVDAAITANAKLAKCHLVNTR